MIFLTKAEVVYNPMCEFSRLLSVLFLLVAGCARLPDYAVPHVVELNNISEKIANGVPYRALEVEDFRAKNVLGDRNGHANRLNAQIFTHIRLTESTRFLYHSKRDLYKFRYQGKVEDIGFEAVMLPDYSWWSRKVSPFQKPYTLQHEQIHFAITELTARNLSQKARRELQKFVVIEDTKEKAEERLQKKITTLIRDALNRDLQRQLEFDQETSLRFDPRKQQEWFEKVNAQLQETEFERYSVIGQFGGYLSDQYPGQSKGNTPTDDQAKEKLCGIHEEDG